MCVHGSARILLLLLCACIMETSAQPDDARIVAVRLPIAEAGSCTAGVLLAQLLVLLLDSGMLFLWPANCCGAAYCLPGRPFGVYYAQCGTLLMCVACMCASGVRHGHVLAAWVWHGTDRVQGSGVFQVPDAADGPACYVSPGALISPLAAAVCMHAWQHALACCSSCVCTFHLTFSRLGYDLRVWHLV